MNQDPYNQIDYSYMDNLDLRKHAEITYLSTLTNAQNMIQEYIQHNLLTREFSKILTISFDSNIILNLGIATTTAKQIIVTLLQNYFNINQLYLQQDFSNTRDIKINIQCYLYTDEFPWV
ncbi:MAG: hypothetical protein EOP34_02725 [Rickettsiales bacterium]|nr:MAG: hypothetical protein EOP34_02725 [Rickettsiales bacterium]